MDELICDLAAHGLPSSVTIGSLISLIQALIGGPSPTWPSAYDGATPAPNTAGGVDQYSLFLDLIDPANCGVLVPMETGLIVERGDGARYQDGICPAPGCYYVAPTGISPGDPPILGTCN